MIFKTDNIEGFDGFYWDDHDVGAWWGPLNDWNTSHKAVIERIARRGTVLQAGGNCGLYPVLLSKYFDRVITFEPDESNYDILVKNLEHHKIENVAAFNFALGETSRVAGLTKGPKDNVGMHKIDDGPGSAQVQMVTIDSMFGDPVDKIDFIWLDIELYEQPAIKGALGTLQLYKPLLMLENRNYAIEVMLNGIGYTHITDSKMDSIFGHKDGDHLL